MRCNDDAKALFSICWYPALHERAQTAGGALAVCARCVSSAILLLAFENKNPRAHTAGALTEPENPIKYGCYDIKV